MGDQGNHRYLLAQGQLHETAAAVQVDAVPFGPMSVVVLVTTGVHDYRVARVEQQANAYAERWVRTLRHELLDRTIIWNERQLRRLLAEYVEHYHEHRPHRSLGQRAPNDNHHIAATGKGHPIRRHTTCGGLINEYRSAA